MRVLTAMLGGEFHFRGIRANITTAIGVAFGALFAVNGPFSANRPSDVTFEASRWLQASHRRWFWRLVALLMGDQRLVRKGGGPDANTLSCVLGMTTLPRCLPNERTIDSGFSGPRHDLRSADGAARGSDCAWHVRYAAAACCRCERCIVARVRDGSNSACRHCRA